jgi:hypothetical protein
MAQCKGTTKKGAQCLREASAGSGFCAIHSDQEVRTRTTSTGPGWDASAVMKALIGFALVGTILVFRFRR